MSLDKIIILVLALLFFGGIAILAWRSRKDEKGAVNQSTSVVKDKADSSFPKQPKGQKGRGSDV